MTARHIEMEWASGRIFPEDRDWKIVTAERQFWMIERNENGQRIEFSRRRGRLFVEDGDLSFEGDYLEFGEPDPWQSGLGAE